MTKKQCPLGEACDLTTAWMAGAAKAKDQIEAQAAEIERLRGALREVNMMINAEDQTFAERLMRASLFTRSALTGAKT